MNNSFKINKMKNKTSCVLFKLYSLYKECMLVLKLCT